MTIIKAINGTEILIDVEDWDLLNKHPWYIVRSRNTFYAITISKGKATRMHRLILGIKDPKIQIDHKDGNGLNNCRNNLRIATNADNAKNRIGYGRSKYKGVTFEYGRWRARMQVKGKPIGLGHYGTEEEAAKAVNDWISNQNDPFYRKNIIK